MRAFHAVVEINVALTRVGGGGGGGVKGSGTKLRIKMVVAARPVAGENSIGVAGSLFEAMHIVLSILLAASLVDANFKTCVLDEPCVECGADEALYPIEPGVLAYTGVCVKKTRWIHFLPSSSPLLYTPTLPCPRSITVCSASFLVRVSPYVHITLR